jgi:hypothetical protein
MKREQWLIWIAAAIVLTFVRRSATSLVQKLPVSAAL